MKDAYKQKIPGVGLILNTISPPSSGAILALMLKIIDRELKHKDIIKLFFRLVRGKICYHKFYIFFTRVFEIIVLNRYGLIFND